MGACPTLLSEKSLPESLHKLDSCLVSAGRSDSSQPGGTLAPNLTQRVHSHSHATTSTSAAVHPPLTNPPVTSTPDPKPQQPEMDTEKLKAALQQMIVGGAMTPAAKQSQSTSPPISGSELQLWGAQLKRRLKVICLRSALIACCYNQGVMDVLELSLRWHAPGVHLQRPAVSKMSSVLQQPVCKQHCTQKHAG